MNYRRILIAVDSRANSLVVARKGFELAEQLKAEAALIYVVDRSKALGNPDTGLMKEEALASLRKESQDTLEQLVHLNKEPAKTIRFMPEGHPKEEILRTAKVWDADLILIGINGKSGFALWAMGSITQYVILHAPIPIMVVPMPQ